MMPERVLYLVAVDEELSRFTGLGAVEEELSCFTGLGVAEAVVSSFTGLETRLRRRRGDTDVERDDEEEEEDEERDDPLELLPLELLPLELLPLLAALLERELLVDAVRLFFVRSRLRSFFASADRTRLGLAAMTAVACGGRSQDWFSSPEIRK